MEKSTFSLLPIKNDYVFKRIFSYEGNEDVLIDLLEAILKIKIRKIVLKNPEMISERESGKKFILDIKAELDDGTIVDIEMQTSDEKNIEERSTTYSGRMISEQLQAGDKYTKLNKVIFIVILNFEYYKRNSYYHIVRPRFDEIEEEYFVDMGYVKQDEIATKYIEMHYIELPKYFKKNPAIKTKLDEWLWLFSGDEEKMEMVKRKNNKVKKAMNTLERISLDPKERQMYEDIKTEEFLQRVSENNIRKESEKIGFSKGHDAGRKEGEKIGFSKGQDVGRAEGEDIGKRKKEIEIAKKMLDKNIKIEEIMEITELTKEEIEKIKKQIN